MCKRSCKRKVTILFCWLLSFSSLHFNHRRFLCPWPELIILFFLNLAPHCCYSFPFIVWFYFSHIIFYSFMVSLDDSYMGDFFVLDLVSTCFYAVASSGIKLIWNIVVIRVPAQYKSLNFSYFVILVGGLLRPRPDANFGFYLQRFNEVCCLNVLFS